MTRINRGFKKFLAMSMIVVYLTGLLAGDVYADPGGGEGSAEYTIDKRALQESLLAAVNANTGSEFAFQIDEPSSAVPDPDPEASPQSDDYGMVDTGGQVRLYGKTVGSTYFLYMKAADSSEEAVYYLPQDSSGLFADIFTDQNLMQIDLTGFDASKVTDMHGMFSGLTSLQTLTISGFDTGNVTNMASMFAGCTGLSSMDFTAGFDTSSVTDMRSMFQDCNTVQTLNLAGFDTSSVTDMRSMFQGCGALKTIQVGRKWDTDRVTASAAMFEGCTNLKGGAGTTYLNSNTDKTYARVDSQASPGYLTYSGAYTVSVNSVLDQANEEELEQGETGGTACLIQTTANEQTVETAEVSAAAGSLLPLKATAKDGYLFQNWTAAYKEDAQTSVTVTSPSDPLQATITVPEADITVTAHFVRQAPAVTVGELTFTNLETGYARDAADANAQTLRITNTGNVPVTIQSVAVVSATNNENDIYFTVERDGDDPIGLALNQNNTDYKIKVKQGLTAGNYTSTVKVTWVVTSEIGKEDEQEDPIAPEAHESVQSANITVRDAGAAILQSVTSPALKEFENKTSAASINAYIDGITTVSINGTRTAGVSWDKTPFTSGYNENSTAQQSFSLTGTVTLPDGMEDPDNKKGTAVLKITVLGAEKAAAPTSSLMQTSGEAESLENVYDSFKQTELHTTTQTEGDHIAEIYYTVKTVQGSLLEAKNGSFADPVPGGTSTRKYGNEKITVPDLNSNSDIYGKTTTTVIKAMTVREDMQYSDIATFYYTVDMPTIYNLTVAKEIAWDGSLPESEQNKLSLTADVINASGVEEDGFQTTNANGDIRTSILDGKTVSLEAVPVAGYEFGEWKTSGGGFALTDEQKTNAEISITMPKNDITVTAVFRQLTIKLQVEELVFDAVPRGYIRPAAKTLMVANSGNTAARITSVTVSGNDAAQFDITYTGDDAASVNNGELLPSGGAEVLARQESGTQTVPGSAGLWSVRPKEGLAPGTYEMSLILGYQDAKGKAARTQAGISFIVTNPKLLSITPFASITAERGLTPGQIVTGYFTGSTSATNKKTVSVSTEDAAVTRADVSWSPAVYLGSYDPAAVNEQTFTIRGEVELPDGVVYTGGNLTLSDGKVRNGETLTAANAKENGVIWDSNAGKLYVVCDVTVPQADQVQRPVSSLEVSDLDSFFTGNQETVLSSGTEGAHIYYTTCSYEGAYSEQEADKLAAPAVGQTGTEACPAGQKLSITGEYGKQITTVIKAYAIKDGMRASETAVFHYTVKLPQLYTLTVKSRSTEQGDVSEPVIQDKKYDGEGVVRESDGSYTVKIAEGGTVTLTAASRMQYLFKQWEAEGLTLSESDKMASTDKRTRSQITITIPTGNETPAGSVTAAFEPKTIALAAEDLAFSYLQEGYREQELSAQTLTITNSGNSDAEITAVSVSGNDFVLSGPDAENGGAGASGSGSIPEVIDTVESGAANTNWTIKPAIGLAAGRHTASITITYKAPSGAAVTAEAQVSVDILSGDKYILTGVRALTFPNAFENGSVYEDIDQTLQQVRAKLQVRKQGQESELDAAVLWDESDIQLLKTGYDADSLEEQTFTLKGEAVISDNTLNPDQISTDGLPVTVVVNAAPRVGTPTVSLASGGEYDPSAVYSRNPKAVLESVTPGAEIYYTMTTDTGMPPEPSRADTSGNSKRYAGTISMNGIYGTPVTVHIRAIAYPAKGARMRSSEMADFTFVISLPALYNADIRGGDGGSVSANALTDGMDEDEKNATVVKKLDDGSYLVTTFADTLVTLKAYPDEKHYFKEWRVTGSTKAEIADAASPETTVTMPKGDTVIEAVFEPKTILIGVTLPAFGTVQEEYAQPQPAAIRIVNSGNTGGVLKQLQISGDEFLLFGQTASGGLWQVDGTLVETDRLVPAQGAAAEWFLQPKAGLMAGTYNVTITAVYTDIDGEIKTASAQTAFIVTDRMVTIRFDANGGSGSMTPLYVKKGTDMQLPDNGFTPPAGMQFTLWAVGSQTGTTVKAGGAQTFLEDTVVYALWQEADTSFEQPQTQPYKVTKEQKQTNAIMLNAGLKLTAKSTKLTVSWGKVKDADGYQIYAAYAGKKFSTKTASKTIKKADTLTASITKIGGSKLNAKNNCKVYVTAYKNVDGKKVMIGESLVVYAAGVKNKTYTSPKKVTVKKTKVTLKAGRTTTIKATITYANKKKKKMPASYCKELRYASSNKNIATVTGAGKIKAVAKGKCTIYVYTQSGYAKKISVTVK